VIAEAVTQDVREAKSLGLPAGKVRQLFEAAVARWFPEEK